MEVLTAEVENLAECSKSTGKYCQFQSASGLGQSNCGYTGFSET